MGEKFSHRIYSTDTLKVMVTKKADSKEILAWYVRRELLNWLQEDSTRTQVELAKHLGLSKTAINEIRNTSRNVGLKTLLNYSKWKNVSLDELEQIALKAYQKSVGEPTELIEAQKVPPTALGAQPGWAELELKTVQIYKNRIDPAIIELLKRSTLNLMPAVMKSEDVKRLHDFYADVFTRIENDADPKEDE